LLQEVGGDKDASDDDDDSSDEEDVSSSEGDSGSSSSDGGGDTAANYRAVVNGLVREGFQMNTKKTGTLKKGSEINALETRVNDQGVTRVRFDNGQLAGWASTRAGDGSTLLEKIGENDAESNGAPGRKIWYASGDDELEVTVKDFQALVRNGTVDKDTEVWVDGVLDDWIAFGQVSMAQLIS